MRIIVLSQQNKQESSVNGTFANPLNKNEHQKFYKTNIMPKMPDSYMDQKIKKTLITKIKNTFGVYTMEEERLQILIRNIKDEFGVSLKDKFIDQVDKPRVILRSMVNTSMNWKNPQYDLWSIGKTLQRDPKYDIPYQCELEVSAGLWYLIYKGEI